MPIKDTPQRYGTITRTIHWTMAALFVWQYAGMISKVTLGKDHGLTKALSANHAQIGTILFILIALRIIWAVMNRDSRPAQDPGLPGMLARLGHFALYALMLLVPSVALIRAWGNQRSFAPFGFEIFPARPESDVVSWAVELGGLLHGEAAWVMGVLVLGHIAMAFWHQFVLRDGLMRRIAH